VPPHKKFASAHPFYYTIRDYRVMWTFSRLLLLLTCSRSLWTTPRLFIWRLKEGGDLISKYIIQFVWYNFSDQEIHIHNATSNLSILRVFGKIIIITWFEKMVLDSALQTIWYDFIKLFKEYDFVYVIRIVKICSTLQYIFVRLLKVTFYSTHYFL